MADGRTEGVKNINELVHISEDEKIYIWNADGSVLEPTTRHHHIQRLLDRGKALLISMNPWIVQLKYQIEEPVVHEYVGATDPGRTNIGEAVIDVTEECAAYLAKLETRNKDIPDLVDKCSEHRNTSRRGERKRRKRRSHKLGQLNVKIERDGGRKLSSCDEKIPVKDIINTEARFQNRKRPEGWLTPTATQLVRTHLNMVDYLCKLYPITSWCFEWNKFAFMKLDDGSIFGLDYQNGKMKGFDSIEDYVYARQEGQCFMPGCQNKIEHCHHVVPKHEGGSDLPDNRVGLCHECHERVHTGTAAIPADGFKKQYGALSVLNQAIPYIYQGLVERFGKDNVLICSGVDTAKMRDELGLDKDHHLDAIAVYAACTGDVGLDLERLPDCERYRQFRRHDRQLVRAQYERTYKLDGKTVAKNRKPRFEQPKDFPALSDAGLSQQEISRLEVRKSYRSYKDPGRVLPGALYLVNNRVCVLTGQQGRGKYLLFKYDIIDENGRAIAVKADKCELLCLNKGIVRIDRK